MKTNSIDFVAFFVGENSDFCKKELNEQTFTRKVARLNTNILYLCYTQRVKMSSLSPTHTLENINKLLNLEYSDLGCVGAVNATNTFADTLDLRTMQNILNGAESGSEEGSN